MNVPCSLVHLSYFSFSSPFFETHVTLVSCPPLHNTRFCFISSLDSRPNPQDCIILLSFFLSLHQNTRMSLSYDTKMAEAEPFVNWKRPCPPGPHSRHLWTALGWRRGSASSLTHSASPCLMFLGGDYENPVDSTSVLRQFCTETSCKSSYEDLRKHAFSAGVDQDNNACEGVLTPPTCSYSTTLL